MNSLDMMAVIFGVSSLVMVIRLVGSWRARRASMRQGGGASVAMPGLALEGALRDEDRGERADRGLQLPPWRDASGAIPLAFFSMRVEAGEALPQLSVVAVDTPERQLLVGFAKASVDEQALRPVVAELGPHPPIVQVQGDAIWLRWRLTDVNKLEVLDALLDGLREAVAQAFGAAPDDGAR